MQVISGPMGKETMQFEAPPSSRVPGEMKRFIDWFNETGPGGGIKKVVVRSAVAHLYFESINPLLSKTRFNHDLLACNLLKS
jgi:Fic family protein